jgi:hypothetical protein
LASDAAPLFTLHARLDACHPISRRRLAREPVILNREGGSSAAMAVDGGRRSRRKTGAEDKGDGRKRQEGGSMDPYARCQPLFILPSKRQPIGRGLRAHITCSAYLDADKWVWASLISRCWTTRRWSGGTKTESPRIPYAQSPVGSGIVIMITSGPVISAEQ